MLKSNSFSSDISLNENTTIVNSPDYFQILPVQGTHSSIIQDLVAKNHKQNTRARKVYRNYRDKIKYNKGRFELNEKLILHRINSLDNEEKRTLKKINEIRNKAFEIEKLKQFKEQKIKEVIS